MHPGVIGGVVGGAAGLIGGALGTWMSIRNTGGPRERAFVIRACVVGWLVGLGFLALLLLLPLPWRFFVWIPYGILMPLGILHWNRTQQRIRQEERAAGPGARPA